MTKPDDDGGPALPPVLARCPNCEFELCVSGVSHKTLLDEFAGQALAGWCADGGYSGDWKSMALDAYSAAAAMLAERRRRESGEGDDAPES